MRCVKPPVFKNSNGRQPTEKEDKNNVNQYFDGCAETGMFFAKRHHQATLFLL
jgi:hypothetical protein